MSKKTKKAPACTPQSWEDADTLMAEFGEIDAKLIRNQADCETAVAKVKATYQTVATPLEARKTEIFEAIECYAAANRKKLTDDGKTKTVTMTTGSFGWRICPPSVAFAKGMKAADIVTNIKTLIGRLRPSARNFERDKTILESFIRVKEEPNKDAMLADAIAALSVDGVRIVTGKEEFFLDPSIAELPEPK